MPVSPAHLRLELTLPEPGHKTPHIALLDEHGFELTRIATSEPAPCLPIGDASVQSVDAIDVLEHVHDEQMWLAELARILVPGGDLTVRVPLENLMGWADALNIYRYVTDVTGLGRDLVSTMPTGWHRHYAPSDMPALVRLAGFEVTGTVTEGLPLEEIPHLAGLVVGNILLDDHTTERRLSRLRKRFERRPRLRLPRSLAATITVRARRVRPAYRPNPDLDPTDRPERETAGTLE
jgi:hypothetical protein